MVTQTADVLMKQNHGRSFARREDKDLLKQESLNIRESKVSDFVSIGIGVHHAGMDAQDRHAIERLFRQGTLPILVATSTLAMGVNLPAHLVILKSTTFYSMGCPTEYPDTQILQMIGRAGRPQFDTTATAVIMTKTSSKAKYEGVVNGTQTIESSLHKNLIEHLNAEIVLHTITDIALAVEWIRHTFLYVRIMKNPSHYSVPPGLDRKQVEKRLEDLCLKNVNSLAELNLVKMNEETLEIQSTETGKLMARYCIAFDTMKKFHDIKGEEHIEQLLTLTTDCAEFADVTLRQTERTALNTLNKDKNKENIRYPMTGKIKTKQMKVNCLIQATFGCLPIHDYALTNDVTKIFRVGQRVVKCLLEFLWQRSDYRALLSAIQLSKCFKQRLWEDSKYVTKQLDKIGTTISLALANAGLTSFHKLGETNPREIELIANRHPPFGNQVKDAAASLPKYELAIEQVKKYKANTAEIIITIGVINKDVLQAKPNYFHQAYFLIGDTNNNVVFKWRIIDSVLIKEGCWRRKIEIKRCNGGPDLYVHLLSQEWVGVDIHTIYVPLYTSNNQHVISTPSHQEQSLGKVTVPSAQNYPSQMDQGKATCAHKCVNKMLCAHKCCKDGVTSKRPVKTSKTPLLNKEHGLQVQIKHMKSRAEDFPLLQPDLKRTRLGQSAQQPAGIDLTRFAYEKKSTPIKQKAGTGYTNMTDTSDVTDREKERCDIRVEDGWEKLHQHQQDQHALYNQGNFYMELSPVIDNDTSPDNGISYSPVEQMSICSMDEFDNPLVPTNKQPRKTNIDGRKLSDISIDTADTISIESVGYYNGKNVINFEKTENGCNNSTISNRWNPSASDVTYWNPGFSSDEDMDILEHEKLQKNSVIIGKAPNNISDSVNNQRKSNLETPWNVTLHQNNDKYNQGNQQRSVDLDNNNSSVTENRSGKTRKHRSSLDVNNLFCTLDIDIDDNKTKFSYDEDLNLPTIKYPGTVRQNNETQTFDSNKKSQIRSEFSSLSTDSSKCYQENIQRKQKQEIFQIDSDDDFDDMVDFDVDNKMLPQSRTNNIFDLYRKDSNQAVVNHDQLNHLTIKKQAANSKVKELKSGENNKNLILIIGSVKKNDVNQCKENKDFFALQQEIRQKERGKQEEVVDAIEFSQIIPNCLLTGSESTTLLKLSQPQNVSNIVSEEMSNIEPLNLNRKTQLQTESLLRKDDKENKPIFNLKSVNYLYSDDDTSKISNGQLTKHDRVICRYEQEEVLANQNISKGQSFSQQDRFRGKSSSKQERSTHQPSSEQEKYTGKSFSEQNRSSGQSFCKPDRSRGHSFREQDRSTNHLINEQDRSKGHLFSEQDRSREHPINELDRPRCHSFSEQDSGGGHSCSEQDTSREHPINKLDRPRGHSLSEQDRSKEHPINELDRPIGHSFSEQDSGRGQPFSEQDSGRGQPFSEQDRSREHLINELDRSRGQSFSEQANGRGETSSEQDSGRGEPFSEQDSGRGEPFSEQDRSRDQSFSEDGPRCHSQSEEGLSSDYYIKMNTDQSARTEFTNHISKQPPCADRLEQYKQYKRPVKVLDCLRPTANFTNSVKDVSQSHQYSDYRSFGGNNKHLDYSLDLQQGRQHKTSNPIQSRGQYSQNMDHNNHQRSPIFQYIQTPHNTQNSKLTEGAHYITSGDYSKSYSEHHPADNSKEHRYGQVLAWIPNEGNSPRPTTLPLKSPVPPAYLSQSPNNVNSSSPEIEEAPFIEPGPETLRISSFFCSTTAKGADSPTDQDNFNNLFEGIF